MIRLENISKRYHGNVSMTLDKLSISIERGEFCVFVGPSGCGKTTTLRMINRLEVPDSGEVYIDNKPLSGSDIIRVRRKIGFVMQSPALFPHRTVADNIATVPRLLGWDKKTISRRIDELVSLMSLDPVLLRRLPHQLSGGQQSRVSIARALASDPPVLLMDEPFAAIDPMVREKLQEEMLILQSRLHKTIVMVTHDINEAIRLGDRIAIFREGGELVQFDTPDRILAAPAGEFVRLFTGSEPTLKRLGMKKAGDLTLKDIHLLKEEGTALPEFTTLSAGRLILVLDQRRHPVCWESANGTRAPVHTVREQDSLRYVYSLMLEIPQRIAVRIDEEGVYTGVIDIDTISDALKSPTERRRHE